MTRLQLIEQRIFDGLSLADYRAKVSRELDAHIAMTWQRYRAERRYISAKGPVVRHPESWFRAESAAETLREELLHLFELRRRVRA